MKYLYLLFTASIISLSGCSQNSKKSKVSNEPPAKEIKAGGRCEDCTAIYESSTAFEQLKEVDTLPDYNEPGPKIEISGIIYQHDGKTPASNVVLYIYHTDQQGLYSKRGKEKGRHGYIRGWIKTNANGFYKFYTLIPASYPNSNNPKHIHPIIKEPGISEYWIEEFLFDDDLLLPAQERTKANPRGGSGILKTELKEGQLKATRNIILGLNVSDYPDK